MAKCGILAAVLATLLAACGGGADGGGSLNATPPAPTTWATQVQGTHWAWGSAIQALPDGSSIVLGLFDQTAVVSPGFPNEQTIASGSANINGFIAKVDVGGNPLWAHVIASSDLSMAQHCAVLSDGTCYLVGAFTQTLTLGQGTAQQRQLTAVGGQDGFVARLDAQGLPVWVRQLGSLALDQVLGVAVRSNGDVVVTGAYSDDMVLGAGETTETTLVPGTGSNDAFVACYAAAGDLLWARTSQSADSSLATGWHVAALPSGAVVVAGQFKGTATFGPGEANARTLAWEGGVSDVFVERFAADGSLQWVRHNHGAAKEVVDGVLAVSDDSVYVHGLYMGPTTTFEGVAADGVFDCVNGSGAVVVRYDAAGEIAQAVQVADSIETSVTGFATLPTGGFVCSGYIHEKAVLGAGEPNETTMTCIDVLDYDGFVATYAADGTLVAAVQARGPGFDSIRSLALHADGSVVLTGPFQQQLMIGEDPTPAVFLNAGGEYDGMLIRIAVPAPTVP